MVTWLFLHTYIDQITLWKFILASKGYVKRCPVTRRLAMHSLRTWEDQLDMWWCCSWNEPCLTMICTKKCSTVSITTTKEASPQKTFWLWPALSSGQNGLIYRSQGFKLQTIATLLIVMREQLLGFELHSFSCMVKSFLLKWGYVLKNVPQIY